MTQSLPPYWVVCQLNKTKNYYNELRYSRIINNNKVSKYDVFGNCLECRVINRVNYYNMVNINYIIGNNDNYEKCEDCKYCYEYELYVKYFIRLEY